MKFSDYLETEKALPQSQLAELCGVSQGMISHLATGRRRPSGELARKIELLTEGAVTLSDWYPEVTIATPETPEEQAHG